MAHGTGDRFLQSIGGVPRRFRRGVGTLVTQGRMPLSRLAVAARSCWRGCGRIGVEPAHSHIDVLVPAPACRVSDADTCNDLAGLSCSRSGSRCAQDGSGTVHEGVRAVVNVGAARRHRIYEGRPTRGEVFAYWPARSPRPAVTVRVEIVP